MEKSISYKDKIFKMLLELDGEFIISEHVEPNNIKEFTDCVKEFIRVGSRVTGKIIEFSNDYSKAYPIGYHKPIKSPLWAH